MTRRTRADRRRIAAILTRHRRRRKPGRRPAVRLRAGRRSRRPPSPTRARRPADGGTSSSRTALRIAPVPRPWITRTSSRPAEGGRVDEGSERLACLLRASGPGDRAPTGRRSASGCGSSPPGPPGRPPGRRGRAGASRPGRAPAALPAPTTSASSFSIAAIVPRTPRSGATTGSPGASGAVSGRGSSELRAAPARPAPRARTRHRAAGRGRAPSERPGVVAGGARAPAGGRTDLVAKRVAAPPASPRAPALRRGQRPLALALARTREPARSRPRARPPRASAASRERLAAARPRLALSAVARPPARSAASASASSSATRSRSGATLGRAVGDEVGVEAEALGGASACDVPGSAERDPVERLVRLGIEARWPRSRRPRSRSPTP